MGLQINGTNDTISAADGSLSISGTTNASALQVNSQNLPSAGPLSNRNLIINGAMTVAQRGSTGVTESGYGTVDRFSSQWSSGSVTQTQETLSSGDPYDQGFRYFYRQTNTTAASATDSGERKIRHYVEAQNVAGSGWDYTNTSSYITLSFWIRSSVAQEFYGYLRSNDGTNQAYGFSTGSLTSNTWTKVTKTVPGNSNLQFDNNNGAGLELNIAAFFGTNYTDSGYTLGAWAAYSNSSRSPVYTSTWATTASATFDVTGVQIEVGTVATPFEHRSYGDELLRCQRYYQKIPVRTYSWCGYCFSTTDARTAIPLITTMRATGQTIETTNTPRFCTTGGAGTGSIVLSSTSLDAITVQSSGASGLGGAGTTSAMRASSGTAYIGVESEL